MNLDATYLYASGMTKSLYFESVVCRFRRTKYSDQARKPNAGAPAASHRLASQPDENDKVPDRPAPMRSSIEFRIIRKARAGSLRAPESVFENVVRP